METFNETVEQLKAVNELEGEELDRVFEEEAISLRK